MLDEKALDTIILLLLVILQKHPKKTKTLVNYTEVPD